MGDERTGVIHNSSSGGVAGTHPSAIAHEVFVGSATPDQRNLIKAAVIPVACWKVEDVRFEFDSSFVRPEAAEEIGHLIKLRDKHKLELAPRTAGEPPATIFPPLSIFGHADPVGNDDYNKQLSGRRATAIYGLLTRDTHLWEELYSHSFGNDKWGVKAIQIMLAELGLSGGENNGKMDEETREVVKKFQRMKGLPVNGEPDPQTRNKLFLSYMEKLCGKDLNGQGFKLDKEDDFLGRGKDSGGKGDFQGCSEFNPILIFSREKNAEFEQAQDKTIRDAANASNRRVMALLFRPGSRVLPGKWPCPRVKEGVAGCIKRFFSDGEKRRSTRLPDKDRKFKDTRDTFACRFYDRLTNSSPCEGVVRLWVIRLLEDGPEPIDQRKPLANLPFSVTGVGAGVPEIQGTTDSRGVLRIVVRDDPTVMKLLVAGQEFTILAGSLKAVEEDVEGVVQRLQNLGFGITGRQVEPANQLIAGLDRFQRLHKLPVQEPNASFRKKLKDFHGS